MMAPPIQLMIAGAQKSGTSSLIAYAGQHPDIAVHDALEFPFFLVDELYQQGYESAFTRLYDANHVDDKLIAAKHAMLMYSEGACQRLSQHNPDALVVVMLRNPIRRAYSAYWHGRRRGYEVVKTFEEALAAEHIETDQEWYDRRKTAYVFNGVYLPHVQRLKRIFGVDKVLVYTTEDLRYRPVELMQEIFCRIGVEDAVEPNMIERHNTAAKARSETVAAILGRVKESQGGVKRLVKKVLPQRLLRRTLYAVGNINDAQFEPPPMKPETFAMLAAVFHDTNLALADELNRDLSSWNEIPPEYSLSHQTAAAG